METQGAILDFKSSRFENLDCFRSFWDKAVEYQKANDYPLWPTFPREQIIREIESGNHYTVFTENQEIIGYFSIAFSDTFIWKEKEQGDAVYVHRMCVNPEQKGFLLAKHVFLWAKGHAKNMGRNFLRMDTWAENQRLVEYYERCGFCLIETRQFGVVPELPAHYQFTKIALFENQL